MLTIHKYPFSIADEFSIEMPSRSDVLMVGMQGDQPCMWARVDTNAPMETRRYRVFGTGHPMEEPDSRWFDHVGSFQAPPFVWHVYEERDIELTPEP